MPQISSESPKHVDIYRIKPKFAAKVTLIPSVDGNCFADINTQEACTVTQKIDLDQISERRIRTLKDTNIILPPSTPPPPPPPLRMTHFGWFFWYLWNKMASKCPKNFRPPTVISSEHLKTFWRRLLTAVRREWWNGTTGFAIPSSVFDPLPTFAFRKARNTTDDPAVAIPMTFFSSFFLLHISSF